MQSPSSSLAETTKLKENRSRVLPISRTTLSPDHLPPFNKLLTISVKMVSVGEPEQTSLYDHDPYFLSAECQPFRFLIYLPLVVIGYAQFNACSLHFFPKLLALFPYVGTLAGIYGGVQF